LKLYLAIFQNLQGLSRLIKDSGLKIIAFDSLDDAADQAVQLAVE